MVVRFKKVLSLYLLLILLTSLGCLGSNESEKSGEKAKLLESLEGIQSYSYRGSREGDLVLEIMTNGSTAQRKIPVSDNFTAYVERSGLLAEFNMSSLLTSGYVVKERRVVLGGKMYIYLDGTLSEVVSDPEKVNSTFLSIDVVGIAREYLKGEPSRIGSVEGYKVYYYPVNASLLPAPNSWLLNGLKVQNGTFELWFKDGELSKVALLIELAGERSKDGVKIKMSLRAKQTFEIYDLDVKKRVVIEEG